MITDHWSVYGDIYIYILCGREAEYGDWVWRMRGYRSMGSDSNLFKRWSRLVFNSILFPINEFLLAVSLSMFRSKFYRLDISRYTHALYIFFYILYLYRTFLRYCGKKQFICRAFVFERNEERHCSSLKILRFNFSR